MTPAPIHTAGNRRPWQTRPSADRLGNAYHRHGGTEEWRPIQSCPGYQASSWGRIMGPRGRIKTPQSDKDGYEIYGVFDGKRQRNKKGHRMVCEAFHGPAPEGRPFVAHIDGNPTNNRPWNLMWATARENYHHMRTHGTEIRGERHVWSKLTEQQVKEIWLSPMSKRKIAAQFGVTDGAVCGIRSGRCWAEYTKTLPEQPLRPAKNKITPPADLHDMFRQGLGLAEIGRLCGVSKTTVLRWRRKEIGK